MTKGEQGRVTDVANQNEAIEWAVEPARHWPGAWVVEGVENREGRVLQTFFAGPNAEARARSYFALLASLIQEDHEDDQG